MIENEILYHYTTIEGFNGIYTTNSIRLSDCRFLNDSNELFNSISKFKKIINNDFKRVVEQALFHFQNKYLHCVFSLSKSPKILSQWRTYANDGKGIAIGFDKKLFKISSINRKSTFVSCIYEGHDDLISEIALNNTEYFEHLKKTYIDCGDDYIAFWGKIDNKPEPMIKLFNEFLRIKNNAFIEEQEYRFIITASKSSMKTRVSNGLIIPYINEKIVSDDDDKSAFSVIVPEIWLGPKCDLRNKNAIQFLDQFNWASNIKHYDCGYV